MSHDPLPPNQLSHMEALVQACATKNTGLSPPQDSNLGLLFLPKSSSLPAFLILPSSVMPNLYFKQEPPNDLGSTPSHLAEDYPSVAG